MKKFTPLLGVLSCLLLSACEQQPGTTVTGESLIDVTDTTGFVSSFPEDQAQQVPLASQIVVKFSAPILRSSVENGVSFRVSNEMGQFLPGEITYNSAEDQITWTPLLGGQRFTLEPSTHYRVSTQFLKDAKNHPIAPWYFDFDTVDYGSSTGKFYVTKFVTTYLLTTSSVVVEFSAPVYPLTEKCSRTDWSDVFQFTNADLGSIVGTSGEVCTVCRMVQNTKICDQLKFTPDRDKPWLSGSVLLLRVRPSLNFKGLVTDGSSRRQEPLAREATRTLIVFPDLNSVFKK